MPKVGGKRKKARSHKDIDAELEKELPRIFVVKKGDSSAELQQTVQDLRKCFYPNTAMKLEDNNKLHIRTYLKAARYYNVTHLVALQSKNEKNYMRIVKVGGGEMSFRIINYCRMKDVLHNGGQPYSMAFREPLVVLNNFNENGQVRMIGRGLQEMFPPINPEKTKAQSVRRVISLTYTSNKKMIYFRHYKIVVNQAGLNSSFSKLLTQKHVDLSGFSSIADYLASLDNTRSQPQGTENQQKVRLVEMGPRFKLKFLAYKESTGKDQQEGPVTEENLYPAEHEEGQFQQEGEEQEEGEEGYEGEGYQGEE